MSSFSSLKTAIQNAIKANGNQEITGTLLQGILLSIVETLGDSAINTLETGLNNEATTRGNKDTELQNLITGIKSNIDNGYVYAGIATPSTTPVSGKVFYIALQSGTYTNFGNTAVTQGINILKYNGSAWSKDVVQEDNGYSYNNATPLTADTDLNSLTFGVYSFRPEVSPSLIHIPVNSGGGIVIVERSTPMSNSFKQTVLYGNGTEYYRYFTYPSTWTDWTNISPEYNINRYAEKAVNSRAGSVGIVEGTDLNDVTSFGVYSILNASVAATLINSPITDSGAYLIVEKTSVYGTTYKQTIISASGKEYYRFYYFSDGVGIWSDWATISIEDVINKETNKILYSGTGATPIVANTDLNNITSYGTYSITSNVSSTLSHAPRTSGGAMMIVERTTPMSNSCKQTIIYGIGYQYHRFGVLGSGGMEWSVWEIDSTKDFYSYNDAIALGSGTDLNDIGFGVYSFNTSVSPTLVNAPRNSGGGMLIVNRITPTSAVNCKQVAYYGVGLQYHRFGAINGSTGLLEWSAWENDSVAEAIKDITLTDGVNIVIPDYWKNEIENRIEKVLQNRMAIGMNISEFIFITDTHFKVNAKKSPVLCAYLQKALNINNIVFGGDAIDWSDNTKKAGLEELQIFVSNFNYKNLFFTLGNHDRNEYITSSARLSDAELYATIQKQVSNFGVTGKTINISYFDDEVQKIRFVQYNYEITDENVVLNTFNTLGSDWTVIIFSHMYWEADNEGGEPTVKTPCRNMMNRIIAGTYSCTIAAFIVGHCHSDEDDLLDNNIPVISTTTDCYQKVLALSPSMTLGTDTEQAFDIIQIDTVNRKLYYTRVGAGNDREFNY